MRERGWGKWIIVGVVVTLMVVGIAAAIGSSGDSSSDTPFTFSVKETRKPCSAGVFLPPDVAQHFLDRPPPKDWATIQGNRHAIYANSEVVEINLRSGAEEKVTLEGISLQVRKGRRPAGTVLYPPCYHGAHGRVITVDLNRSPPKPVAVITSTEDLISFPWTISLENPVTVYVTPITSRCHCSWRATIPWRSGSDHGKIVVADGKKDFQITYTGGLQVHFSGSGGWS